MPRLGRTDRLESIFLDQVEHRHAPFLLHIGAAPQDRLIVKIDMGNAVFGHIAYAFADARGMRQAF